MRRELSVVCVVAAALLVFASVPALAAGRSSCAAAACGVLAQGSTQTYRASRSDRPIRVPTARTIMGSPAWIDWTTRPTQRPSPASRLTCPACAWIERMAPHRPGWRLDNWIPSPGGPGWELSLAYSFSDIGAQPLGRLARQRENGSRKPSARGCHSADPQGV